MDEVLGEDFEEKLVNRKKRFKKKKKNYECRLVNWIIYYYVNSKINSENLGFFIKSDFVGIFLV